MWEKEIHKLQGAFLHLTSNHAMQCEGVRCTARLLMAKLFVNEERRGEGGEDVLLHQKIRGG